MTSRLTRTLFVAAALSAVAVSGAQTSTTFRGWAAFAPNAFGSPNFEAWRLNYITAIRNGVDSWGDQSTPLGVQNVAGGTFDNRRNIVTNFNAWNGVAGPLAAPFQNELGNRLTFGAHITSLTAFRLVDLSSGIDSTFDDAFGYDVPLTSFAGSSFAARRVGLSYGADNTKGTADDVLYEDDVANVQDDQLFINEIWLTSWGNAAAVLNSSPGGTLQEKIDLASLSIGSYSMRGTFRIGNGPILMTDYVNFEPVPEPFTMALGGAAAVAFIRKRRAARKA